MTQVETIPTTHWAKPERRLELLKKLSHEFGRIVAEPPEDIGKQMDSQNGFSLSTDCLAVENWATQGGYTQNAKTFYLHRLNLLIHILNRFGMTRYQAKVESLRAFVEGQT